MNSNKAKAVLFAVLLFAAGSTVGALGHRYYTANVANAAEDFREKYIREMRTKLKLNQHQVDQLQVILDETKDKFRAARESHHPEMVKIKDDQLTKVKAMLSPDQAKQYEAMVAEREQKFKDQDDRDRQEEARQRAIHLKALNGE